MKNAKKFLINPQDDAPVSFSATLMWVMLMLIAAAALWLCCRDAFRSQSVVVWAQVMLAVAGAFGVITDQPVTASRPSHPPFIMWAKWLLLCFSSIPLLLRIPAGNSAWQVVGGILTGGLLFACSLISRETDFRMLQSVYGFIWLAALYFCAAWYGQNYRWAALFQTFWLIGITFYNRVDNIWDSKTASNMNTLLMGAAIVSMLLLGFFYVPILRFFPSAVPMA